MLASDEMALGVSVDCDHGCAMVFESGHVVPKSIDALGEAMNVEHGKGRGCILPAMSVTYKDHPTVWSDDKLRKMAVDIFVRMGTNAILLIRLLRNG